MPGQRRTPNKAAAAPGSAKRTLKSAGKRRAAEPEVDDGDAYAFMGSDDDDEQQKRRRAGAEEDDEAEAAAAKEAAETAEEKRLRLARTFLDQMRADVEGDGQRRGSGDGSGSSSGDDDGEGGNYTGMRRSVQEELAERLKTDAAEVAGRLQRRLAHRLQIAGPSGRGSDSEAQELASAARGRVKKGHKLSATALALTVDDTTAFSVSKDGSILKWDIETMKATPLHRPGDGGRRGGPAEESSGPMADWVKAGPRQGSRAALYAAAVSSDGQFLAVGGGDKQVYVFDARSGTFIQEYPGHKDIISGLVFREGTHQLLSCSYDRTVKLWSLDDRAYMDTLFGHQAQVHAVDMLRAERAVTVGHDHTARVWKIPEESQLIYRAHNMAVDCVRYVTNTEWLSGSPDGSLLLWSQLKKRPIWAERNAHVRGADAAGHHAGDETVQPVGGSDASQLKEARRRGDGMVAQPDVASWVQSVAVCRGSDLVASGAGDGFVRFWGVQPSRAGGANALARLGALPAPGFVNGLCLARSGRFALAALGQEPRMGRWAREGAARNGVLLQDLTLADE